MIGKTPDGTTIYTEVVISLKINHQVIAEIDKMASETMRSRAGMIRWLLIEATAERIKGRKACECPVSERHACAGLRELEAEACPCECHAK